MNVIEYKKMIDENRKLSSILRKLIEDGSVTDLATMLAVQRCADIIENISINCDRKYESVSEKDTIAFIEELCSIKLYWYQRLLLKMLERSIKNPRKGFTYK